MIWRDGEPIDLVDAHGNPVGEALGASADGRVVVGLNYGSATATKRGAGPRKPACVPIGVIAAPAGTVKLPARIKLAMQQQQDIPSERRDARMQAPDGFFPPQALAIAVSDDGQTIVGGSGILPGPPGDRSGRRTAACSS